MAASKSRRRPLTRECKAGRSSARTRSIQSGSWSPWRLWSISAKSWTCRAARRGESRPYGSPSVPRRRRPRRCWGCGHDPADNAAGLRGRPWLRPGHRLQLPAWLAGRAEGTEVAVSAPAGNRPGRRSARCPPTSCRGASLCRAGGCSEQGVLVRLIAGQWGDVFPLPFRLQVGAPVLGGRPGLSRPGLGSSVDRVSPCRIRRCRSNSTPLG